MQEAKNVIKEILDCGIFEVDMLLESDIDVYETVQYIINEGLTLDMAHVFIEAFWNKVVEVFRDDNRVAEFDENDFYIYYNGMDTNIYIKTGKYQMYKEKYPKLIDELENYMDMEFDEMLFF